MRLLVCRAAPCPTDLVAAEADENVLKLSEAQVLQGGTTFLLPFRARTFASIKNAAGFSKDGVLVSAGSSQTRGAGSGAAAAFWGGAEQVAAIATGSRAAEAAKLQARIDEAKARKALADAEAALAAPAADPAKLAQIAAFQPDATLAAAERAKIEAQAALALSKVPTP